jgi:uncharacterized protein YbaR (Trm112 family)
MIEKDLLDILVCPQCKTPVTLKDDGQGLRCSECRRVYPIRDNIPIMLVDEAVVEPL